MSTPPPAFLFWLHEVNNGIGSRAGSTVSRHKHTYGSFICACNLFFFSETPREQLKFSISELQNEVGSSAGCSKLDMTPPLMRVGANTRMREEKLSATNNDGFSSPSPTGTGVSILFSA